MVGVTRSGQQSAHTDQMVGVTRSGQQSAHTDQMVGVTRSGQQSAHTDQMVGVTRSDSELNWAHKAENVLYRNLIFKSHEFKESFHWSWYLSGNTENLISYLALVSNPQH